MGLESIKTTMLPLSENVISSTPCVAAATQSARAAALARQFDLVVLEGPGHVD